MIEDLPHYIECDDCELKHFLCINRDLYGRWSAAYLAFTNEGEAVIPHLFINGAETLSEAAIRLGRKIEHFNG